MELKNYIKNPKFSLKKITKSNLTKTIFIVKNI